MWPSEVRQKILSEHDRIRIHLSMVEDTAHRLAHNQSLMQEMRHAITDLLRFIRQHVDFEDSVLVPVLREADLWGNARAQELTEHHKQQRREIELILNEINVSQNPELLSQRVLNIIDEIRADMNGEEKEYLNNELLRDDVIGIDVSSG